MYIHVYVYVTVCIFVHMELWIYGYTDIWIYGYMCMGRLGLAWPTTFFIISCVKNLHLVKASTQPGWWLGFSPPENHSKIIWYSLIHCHHICVGRLKQYFTVNQQLFAKSLLTSPIDADSSTKKDCDVRTWSGLSLHSDGVVHTSLEMNIIYIYEYIHV